MVLICKILYWKFILKKSQRKSITPLPISERSTLKVTYILSNQWLFAFLSFPCHIAYWLLTCLPNLLDILFLSYFSFQLHWPFLSSLFFPFPPLQLPNMDIYFQIFLFSPSLSPFLSSPFTSSSPVHPLPPCFIVD